MLTESKCQPRGKNYALSDILWSAGKPVTVKHFFRKYFSSEKPLLYPIKN